MSPKLTEQQKEEQRQAEMEKLRRDMLGENNPSLDPRLATRSVGLLSQTKQPERSTVFKPVEQPAPAPVGLTEPRPPVTKSEFPSDPKVVLPSIDASSAAEMRNFKASENATKNNVRVTEQVFNTVAGFHSKHRGLDKLNIVSYLLHRHLPKRTQPTRAVPEYLTKEPPMAPRTKNLSFFEDQSLRERLDGLVETSGAPRVDIIENIILHNLPAPERTFRSKRRRRFIF
jgi:hypothetical protein